MKPFRLTVVLAASVAVLSIPAVSRADDKQDRNPKTSQGLEPKSDINMEEKTTTTTVETTPPPPVVTPAPAPVVPPPTSTTTTSSAMYNEQVGAEKGVTKTLPNRPLLITGGTLFLGSYGASVIAAIASNTHGDNNLYIPVVGPWIDMAQRQCQLGECGGREDFNNVLLIGSGVAQAAGVGLVIASMFAPEHHTTSETMPYGKSKHTEAQVASAKKAQKTTVQVTPVSYQGGAGVGAGGHF